MFKKTALFYVVIYIKNAIKLLIIDIFLCIFGETEEFLSKEAIKWNSK